MGNRMVTKCWGAGVTCNGLASHPWGSNAPGQLHATESRIRSGRVGQCAALPYI